MGVQWRALDNTTVLDGDLATWMPRLRQQYDGGIVAHGSARLAQALLELDLVDELRLMIFLGAGTCCMTSASQ